MSYRIIPGLYKKHIEGTENGAIVAERKVVLCHLTNAVIKGIGATSNKSYVNTRILKHMYDKKPAEEFIFLVDYIHKIVKYPDDIYENKPGKRGAFCFVKKLKGERYICCLEIVDTLIDDEITAEIHLVTAFRVRKDSYLDSYKLLWSWKGDKPSS